MVLVPDCSQITINCGTGHAGGAKWKGREMSETIRILHREHRNLARILDVLEAQLDIYRQGGVPDFDLIGDIVHYTLSFPERHHHPKEDLIFERIEAKGAQGRDLAAELLEEHKMGEGLTRRLAEVLGNIAQDAEVPRDSFEDLARRFLDFNRRHMTKEEDHFFPLAEKLLSAADWSAIDARVSGGDDPLFGKDIDQRYQALRDIL